MNSKIVIMFNLMIIIKLSGEDDSYTFKNIVRFPYSPLQGPFMGIFLAISLPLELPEYNIFFSYNLEANYNLPQNQSEFTYPPLVSRRSWDRKYFYDILEYKMKSHGYPGRNCLLRAICEISLYSSEHTGILGDIFHILLTPSTSINTNILEDYEKAEEYGKSKKNCKKYRKKCSISFLNFISRIEKYFSKY